VKRNRAEGIVQVLILILVAAMAGAASFTHVHNWTMDNAPAGTGSWFGWANAVISELTPTAAGIEIRRRRRNDPHAPIAYPMAILIAAAALSLSAQVAEARPTVGGWISSAVPALAFLALTKLVLSRSGHNLEKEDSECAQPASVTDASTQTSPTSTLATRVAATATATPTTSQPGASSTEISSLGQSVFSADPTAPALTVFPSRDIQLIPSEQLRMSAGMIAFNHQVATGQPITPGELAGRLNVPSAYAESLLDHLGDSSPGTNVNGTVVNGSRP
jgi:hypothetical protein